MTMIPTSEYRRALSDYINRVAYGGERLIIGTKGKRKVAMVSVDDLDLLEMVEDLIDIHEAKAALEEVKKEGTIPLERLESELEI